MKTWLVLFLLLLGLISPISYASQSRCRDRLNSINQTDTPDNAVIQSVLQSEPYQDMVKANFRDRLSNRWKLLVTRLTKTPSASGPRLNAKVFVLLTVLAPASLMAQQSLFNTPSVEATKPQHFFFQEQLNFLTRTGISNTTLDYGLGNGWSTGSF
jgi:hypothetical protein